MSNHPDDIDAGLRDALRDAAPPAGFDAGALRDRIDSSIAGRATPVPWHRAAPIRLAVPWIARAAAAGVVFALGAWYGRSNAQAITPADPASGPFVAGTLPAQLPLSIQSAGTGYVASLAMLSEMRERMTPEQREQARQVALAVLSGAIAELASAGEGRLPDGVLQTVLSYGVPAGGPTDPVVRYR